MNGTTWFDRTNYFETVPRAALDTALFLECDRMGHLLGAVTQEKLDNQRGVVQNEKRQGDNQPFGLVEYAQLERALPRRPSLSPLDDRLDGRPRRRHADDGAATGSATHYGPNNAVLVLAGDIDAAPRRGRWSSAISATFRAGRVNHPAAADVPTLPHRVDRVMHDHVANHPPLPRTGSCPASPPTGQVPLDVAASVLGGLSSSRLDNALVRGEQSAVAVTAGVQPFHRISLFEVTGRREARRRMPTRCRAGSTRSSPISSAPARPPTRCARRDQRDVAGRIQRPRTGRRLRRQGGRARRRRALRQRSRFLPHPARAAGRADARRRSARRCSAG